MSNHIQIIDAFIDAWNRRDADAIVAAFSNDAVYHNIPMDPINGRDAIAAAIRHLVGEMRDVRWIVTAIAESADGSVLTERIDAFTMRGATVSLPVMGIFQFRERKITRWADYFDLATYRAQLAAGSTAP